MGAIDWPALNALIQYAVIPLLAWLWALNKRVGDHHTAIRVMTALQGERGRQNEEERKQLLAAIAGSNKAMLGAVEKLEHAIDTMSQRMVALERLTARLEARDDAHDHERTRA